MYAAGLLDALRMSQRRLVEAREEERRRLRRDLRDGLGPTWPESGWVLTLRRVWSTPILTGRGRFLPKGEAVGCGGRYSPVGL